MPVVMAPNGVPYVISEPGTEYDVRLPLHGVCVRDACVHTPQEPGPKCMPTYLFVN
jgi:hypothetical protein